MKAECPLCAVGLAPETPVCRRCGLTWCVPSRRAIRMEAGERGASSPSMSFRPRTGEVLATLGAIVLFTPMALALFHSAWYGELRSGQLLGSELLWDFVGLLVVSLVALGSYQLFSGAAVLAGRVAAPRRLVNHADVLAVRPGGWSQRGRAEVRIAKADLREVVLEPHAGGYLHDLHLVHRAGLAMVVATEIPQEVAVDLGRRLAGWLGSPAQGDADYRKPAR